MNENDNKSLDDLFNEVDAGKPGEGETEIKHGETNNKLDDFDLKDKEIAEKEKVEPVKVNPVIEEQVDPVNVEPEVKKENLTLKDIQNLFEEEKKKNFEEQVAKEKKAKELLEIEEQNKKIIEEEKFAKDFDGSIILSEEDLKNIKEVEENFPEIKKVLDAYDRKADARANKKMQLALDSAVKHIYSEVNKYLIPVYENYNQIKVNENLNKFKVVHPDFNEDMKQDCINWINSYKSENIKKGLNNAFYSDNTDEVIDLFNIYKKEKGIIAPVKVEPEKAKQETVQKQAIKDDKKQALGAVSSKNVSNQKQEAVDESDLKKLFDEIEVKR